MSPAFRTVADLNRCLAANLWRLPRDVDGVVGLPPGGTIAAGIIAAHLDLAVVGTDPPAGGRYLRIAASADDVPGPSGNLDTDRGATSSAPRVVVFAEVTQQAGADLVLETVPHATTFEWSLFHSAAMARACLDIDGVLCRDPSPDENDDGLRYREFLTTAAPLVTPTVPVHTLVTSRLERYRDRTERWLDQHGIAYGELIMMDHPDAAARSRAGRQAAYKAAAYRASDTELFVESDPRLAFQIAHLARRRVVAFPDGTVVDPTARGRVAVRADLARRRARRWLRAARRPADRLYRATRRS